MITTDDATSSTECNAAVMIRLEKDCSEWREVADDFMSRWEKSNITGLRVEDILRFRCSAHLEKSYADYKRDLWNTAIQEGLINLSEGLAPLPDPLPPRKVTAPPSIEDFVLESELYHGTFACISQAVFDGLHIKETSHAAPLSIPSSSTSEFSASQVPKGWLVANNICKIDGATEYSTLSNKNSTTYGSNGEGHSNQSDINSEDFILCETDFVIHSREGEVNATFQKGDPHKGEQIVKTCDQKGCAACGIVRNSFDLNKSGKGSKRRQQAQGVWQRFGHGIYFA
ncbi:hypothetical protein BGW41_003885 [Actinomortierella wolfii]|nr:hypothetical protein BGW41_003885 [Actinomortierella wolfii]